MANPGTLEELANAQVSLDATRAEADCPSSREEITEYACWELYGYPEAEEDLQLQFVRQASLDKCEYWLWRCQDDEGNGCFATVTSKPGLFRRSTHLCVYGAQSLTPEQFILGLRLRLIPS